MELKTLKKGRIIECPECERRLRIKKDIEEIVFLKCKCGAVLISKMFKPVD